MYILQSNFYLEAAKLIANSALTGTAAMLIEEDKESVVRYKTFPTGQYYMGVDYRGRANEFMRIFPDTAANIVREFGEENCSESVVRSAKDRKSSGTKYDVLHYVGPNDEYDGQNLFGFKGKKFVSAYIELGPAGHGSSNSREYDQRSIDNKVLRKSGYHECPIVGHRWGADASDNYGSMYPGLMALGLNKSLQKTHKLYLQGLELQMKPPMQASLNSRNQQIQMLPGFVNHVDMTSGGAKPLFDARPDMQSGAAFMDFVENKIRNIFFNDVFLMLSNNRRSGTKAREIESLDQERMMLMSPVLESFTDEFLDPCIERTHNIIERRGLHPIPPPQFQGQKYEVEFINILSTTLKMQGIASMDRVMAVSGQIGAAHPEVLDNVNWDRFFNVYASRTDVDPRVLATPEEIAATRDGRRAQAEQQAMQQQAQMGAETAKILSETKTDTDNGLTQLMNMAGG
jgi:hypothetical protein